VGVKTLAGFGVGQQDEGHRGLSGQGREGVFLGTNSMAKIGVPAHRIPAEYQGCTQRETGLSSHKKANRSLGAQMSIWRFSLYEGAVFSG
jgi:hypothetical protein